MDWFKKSLALVMNVNENGDGTPIKFLKLDEEGKLTFDIPNRPYRIFLDGGAAIGSGKTVHAPKNHNYF